MTKMKLADYLFKRIEDCGVEYTFGIPGDFVLPVYAAQEHSKLKTVVMTHEPSVGYAADAYARLKGLGVALVTYGAGGLNMVNPIGLAYAEESPVLVISGGPETRFRSGKAELHHCVKTFDTQARVYAEVTAAQTILSNAASAQKEIDQVFNTILAQSRPGYIEIPRDLVNVEIETVETKSEIRAEQNSTITNLAKKILDKISQSKQPILFVGAQTKRFKLTDKVVALAEALNLPVITSILGKASFPESSSNFIGTYFGQFGSPQVRQYVESADCILSLGVVLTEMETGGYTANLDPNKLIQITKQETIIDNNFQRELDFKSLIVELLNQASSSTKKFTLPEIVKDEEIDSNKNQLDVLNIIKYLNNILSDKYMVVSDVGDCLYAGLSLHTDTFIAPGYYSSMGFGVPAAIGAQLAQPNKRPIVLVGDGAFQMTGMEISTAAKMGLNPIIVVFNNANYGMLRFVDQKRNYYNLASWNYVQLANSLGARGTQAETKEEFQRALNEAQSCNLPYLIDARISEDDISPTLKRLTDHFGKKVRAAIT